MARKFKIGDKVRVVQKGGQDSTDGVKVGHLGTVTKYNSMLHFRYSVTRKNGECDVFNASELELIKRKENK